MNDFQIIYDLVCEVRKEQKEQTEVLHEQSKSLFQLNCCVEKNTSDLAEHIRRTGILEDISNSHEERLNKIEEPKKIAKWLWNKYIKALGATTVILAFLTGILKLLNYI